MTVVLFETTMKMQNVLLPGTAIQMCDYRFYWVSDKKKKMQHNNMVIQANFRLLLALDTNWLPLEGRENKLNVFMNHFDVLSNPVKFFSRSSVHLII